MRADIPRFNGGTRRAPGVGDVQARQTRIDQVTYQFGRTEADTVPTHISPFTTQR
jgi:hypothetical protein